MNNNNISISPNLNLFVNDSLPERLPNIYYIVLDGYPSSSFLKENLNLYPNTLDSGLAKRGFYIAKKSTSTYNYTAFSIASVFTMTYLSWIRNSSYRSPEDFNKAALLIKKAPMFNWLQKNGYTINNFSFFDINKERSITDTKYYYVISPNIVFRNTLWNKIKWEVIPALFPTFVERLNREQAIDVEHKLANYKAYDKMVYNLLIKKNSSTKNNRFFTYAHFEMPHSPYLYDSSGKEYSAYEVYGTDTLKRKKMYTNYITYVNKKITAAIDSILINNPMPPVIIIQSDHGCREGLTGAARQHYFQNYSAFYFPDKNYSMLNDSISNVNTFRIIANKFFNQKLPLLKDSTIYLKF